MATIGQQKANKSKTGSYTSSSGKVYTSSKASASTPTTGGSSTGVPAYNAATGATTGKPSAEYDTYLKSLNKKGSANYVNTPDDAGFENMDELNNAKLGAASPLKIENAEVPSLQKEMPSQVSNLTNPTSPTNGVPSTVTPQGQVSPTFLPPAVNSAGGNKYQQALDTVKSSGLAAPTSGGLASASIQQAMKGVPQDPAQGNVVGQIMDTDSNFDSILTGYDDFFSPPKQKQSLVQEYQSMLKASGIQSINESLIDAKRVIEGTEDDIRLEVEKAGGFATDSQVQALAIGRNKSLIKNYNYLLESRDNAMTQLNTMMNLTVQDRQAAQAEFDRKLNYAFNIL